MIREFPGLTAYLERVPSTDTWALWLYENVGRQGQGQMLYPDAEGTWQGVPVGVGERLDSAGARPVLLIPGGLVGAIARAFAEEFAAGKPDPGTEAKVLRESLELERRRVDQALAHILARVE